MIEVFNSYFHLVRIPPLSIFFDHSKKFRLPHSLNRITFGWEKWVAYWNLIRLLYQIQCLFPLRLLVSITFGRLCRYFIFYIHCWTLVHLILWKYSGVSAHFYKFNAQSRSILTIMVSWNTLGYSFNTIALVPPAIMFHPTPHFGK